MSVITQAQIAVCDPSFGRDRRSLDHQQAEATESETSVVDGVVIAGMTLCRRVLTHRTKDEAVAQGDAA
ncbi:hypothetical protein CFII68_23303 [Pseudomonas sp. CFII68]|nr:hypothetical protein CFII68_23303 [Pseudomonas sp. CFII68]